MMSRKWHSGSRYLPLPTERASSAFATFESLTRLEKRRRFPSHFFTFAAVPFPPDSTTYSSLLERSCFLQRASKLLGSNGVEQPLKPTETAAKRPSRI